MEKDKPLLKDTKPGEMSLRGSITKPDLTGPPAPPTEPQERVTTREALELKGAKPPRRPFEDD